MRPARLDLIVYQGDDWDRVVRFRLGTETYEDLSGRTARAQIRKHADDEEVLAELEAVVMDQSEMPGGVLLRLTSEQTTKMPKGGAVWDLQLTNPNKTRLMGRVRILGQVTR